MSNDEPVFYATRERAELVTCLGFAQDADVSRSLLETDDKRPRSGAAFIWPLQPTHRYLRFITHRAFSYAVSTLP
jgi:hypothetical protein